MLVVTETPDNLQAGSVAVVLSVASMAALILDEWRLVIEVPDEMSDMHARKSAKRKERLKPYRCAIFVYVAGSRSGLVGGINQVFPSFSKVCRGFSRESFSVVTWSISFFVLYSS